MVVTKDETNETNMKLAFLPSGGTIHKEKTTPAEWARMFKGSSVAYSDLLSKDLKDTIKLFKRQGDEEGANRITYNALNAAIQNNKVIIADKMTASLGIKRSLEAKGDLASGTTPPVNKDASESDDPRFQQLKEKMHDHITVVLELAKMVDYSLEDNSESTEQALISLLGSTYKTQIKKAQQARQDEKDIQRDNFMIKKSRLENIYAEQQSFNYLNNVWFDYEENKESYVTTPTDRERHRPSSLPNGIEVSSAVSYPSGTDRELITLYTKRTQ